MNSLKFVDLFCGIGGFHQALSSFGCKCVMACDIDKNCREVYEKNYNIKPLKDIKTIDPTIIEDFDIICAGFPCQPFSNGGKKKTFEDSRGLLFDEIIRIAKVKTPSFMILENVKHIKKVDNGKVFKYILDNIKSIGYFVKTFQLSPHQFGIPQQRERVFFLCIRNDIYNTKFIEKDLKIDIPENIETKLDFFLEKSPDPKYLLESDILKVLESWDEMINIFEIDEKISPTILVNEFYKKYTNSEFKSLVKWKQDYITKNKPLYIKYKKDWDPWYEKNKDIISKREIYAKLEWQVGKIRNEDSIFNYFIQFRQSGIRVKKPHYFPTLVAIGQIPIYAKEKRYITPRECARIQSFPDNFILDINDKKAYKQFGNSVNVQNVKTIFNLIN